MSRFDKARVAEVIVRRGDEAQYGSGYRISTRLVLTVGHLLGPRESAREGESEGPACSVLLGGGETEYSAAVVWRHARRDFAVLRLGAGTGVGSGAGGGSGTESGLGDSGAGTGGRSSDGG